MGMILFRHNEEAYEAALSMLSETGKAAIVHPTGTGKSFIGFKLCEDNPDETLCWLSPSDYIFRTQLENWAKAGGESLENIAFFTYAKLMNMTDAEMAEIKPSYIVFDEFHRAGAEKWSEAVERLLTLYPNVPMLGLSATNIRYLDNQRNMADELFDGNIASEMTLGEAIVRGILNPPKYILSVYAYEQELKKYYSRIVQAKNKATRDKAEKYLDALRRALEKADGLDVIFEKHMTDKTGKYIVFCQNVEHMREMIKRVPEWFYKVDAEPHVYSAYSDDPETSRAFADFKADESKHLKLLFCIDMLNEGVHVENVTGVILFRPTISPIIYKQQIGRALSASKSKEPVIFDIVNNIENLYSISTVEEEMRTAMLYYRFSGEEKEIVNERFRLVDEVRDCRVLFDELNDVLSASWGTMYGYAKNYYEENGNLLVPRRYKTKEGYSLGNWIAAQRKVRKGEQYGNLDESRIAKLDEIGMDWDDFNDRYWKISYQELLNYKEKYGDIRVPATYVTKNGIHLGCWISNLRTYRKNGFRSDYLTKERIADLDALGMLWDVTDHVWQSNYSAAYEYYIKNGNLDVPLAYITEDGFKLGQWIFRLRQIKNGRSIGQKLEDEKITQLNEIGMIWDSRNQQQWERGFAQAKTYYEKNGNLNVPATYTTEDGYKLGKWLDRFREKGKDHISEERAALLDSIGMIWEKENPWEVKFAMCEKYYAEHGDLNVPPDYIVDGVWLNKWLNEQKQAYLGKRAGIYLTPERIKRLEAIGMRWDSRSEQAWEKRYTELKTFCEKYGRLDDQNTISANCEESLKTWIIAQRRSRKDGKMNEKQIALLDALGMRWEVDDTWEVGFQHAEEYFRQTGDLRVPVSYRCDDGYTLGSWIANQRNNRNHPTQYHTITKEQEHRLESIGMEWNIKDAGWEKAYSLAEAYFLQNGHLNIPQSYKKEIGFDLQYWLRQQREKKNTGKLMSDQIQRLNQIGMDWLTPAERAWENAFALAEKYYREHGDLNIPVTYRDESGFGIGAWLVRVREHKSQLKHSGKNGDQIKRLEAIGMIWNRKAETSITKTKTELAGNTAIPV